MWSPRGRLFRFELGKGALRARPGLDAWLVVSLILTSLSPALVPRPSLAATMGPSTSGGQEAAQTDNEQDEGETEEDPGDLLPGLRLYLPEGEFDFRLGRLVRRAFFEGQLRYDFPSGDISAFLRTRYYGFRRTYQIAVFDSLQFEGLEELSNDFERVRGALLLVQWPHNYHQRTSFLAELDALSSNKEEFRFTTNKTNAFLRVGYQLGTPEDSRSNAIVGETRAEIQSLFTAHRKIGPGGQGLTAAASFSGPVIASDFDYVRLRLSGLRRFDVSPRTFLIGRFDLGTFPAARKLRRDPDLPLVERLAVPIEEFFRLDGREKLKGLAEDRRGTRQSLLTGEYFLRWFIDRSHKFLGLEWQSWYWILYAGYGAVGFDNRVLTTFDGYVSDVGFGFEASFRFKKQTFFFSGLIAQAQVGGNGVKTRFGIKSYH